MASWSAIASCQFKNTIEYATYLFLDSVGVLGMENTHKMLHILCRNKMCIFVKMGSANFCRNVSQPFLFVCIHICIYMYIKIRRIERVSLGC